MISGDQIRKIIANPQGIDADQLTGIKTLVDQHPYCSTLQILLLKAMADQNDLNFERQLKITAAHAPDREQVYRLIHSFVTYTANEQETEEVSTAAPRMIEETDLPAVSDTIIDTSQTEEIANSTTLAAVDKSSENPEEIAETLDDQDELSAEADTNISLTAEPSEKSTKTTSEITDESSPDISDNQEDEINEDLERTILTEAIDQHFISTVEADESVVPSEITDNQAEDAQELSEEGIIQDQTSTAFTEQHEQIDETKETTLTADKEQENLSFVDWLKRKQSGILEQKTDQKTPTGTVDEMPEKWKDSSENTMDTVQLRKSKTDALLEKFIAEEPTISRPVKDFYNPAKTAKKSLEESDDLVSETLAKIHYMQKNYIKAITIYEKLILLYPEKKTFFANQIKKIEKEIKTK